MTGEGRTSVQGPGLVVLAAVCWGTGGLAGTLLATQADLSPLAVGAYRVLGAAVVLLVVQLARGAGPALLAAVAVGTGHRTDVLRLVGVGLGLAVFQVAYFAAVAAVGLSVATLLALGLAPVLVTVGGALLLRERAGTRLLVALPVALAGLALLVGTDDAGAGQGGSSVVTGVLLAATAAAGYACVTLLGRSLSARVRGDHVTTLGFAAAALLLLPVGLVGGMSVQVSLPTVALIAYLALVPTAIAYAAFFAGLRRTASGVASVLTLAEPLTATVLAVVLLREELAVAQWLGAGLLGVAVLVLSLRAGAPGRQRAGPEPAVPLGTVDPVP